MSDIPSLDVEDSYKYSGVWKGSNILHKQMKEKTQKEFIRRIRALTKSDLTANNLASAIKSFAMPIMQ